MTAAVHAAPGRLPARSGTWEPVRRLAALEGVRLLRHPAFLAGCALTIAYFLNTREEPNAAYLGLVGAGAMGPGMGILIAANMATLRARADDAEEVLDVVPVGLAARTRALALATLLPAAVSTLLVLALGAVISLWSGIPVALAGGYVDMWPTVVEIAQVPAFVAACGALGVALGRWCPYRLASVALVIATFFLLIPTFFWTADSRLRYLAPLVDHSEPVRWVQATPGSGYNVVAGFDRTGMAWHLAYLAGAVAVLIGVALARHERSPMVNRLLVGGAVLAVIAGNAQL